MPAGYHEPLGAWISNVLTREEAIELVSRDLPESMGIDTDSIVERDYGWIIFPQTKEYLATRDPLRLAIGSGGTLVEKETGKQVEFGSAYPLDINLKIYELGYLAHEDWDIVITKVHNKEETVRSLTQLRPTYVIPEEESGIIWRVPREYTETQISDLLETLPCTINLGSVYFRWELLEAFKDQVHFDYTLQAAHRGDKDGA